MDLSFDAERHEYRLDGSVVPNVTMILAPLYNFAAVSAEVIERKRQIGKALDTAIELDLKDDLDESTIASEVQGPFEAWRRFRAEKKFDCHACQKRVASKKYRYAGTPDAWGLIGGEESIADWKATYAMHPAVALQTAAYAQAGHEMGFFRASVKRYGVRFAEDGRYHMEPYKDKSDFNVFLCLLSTHNWRARHGLLKGTTIQ